MEGKKKLPLPLVILIISIVIGLVFGGICLVKKNAAEKENERRYEQAYKQALENKEKLEKRYAEITEELTPLNSQYEAKTQECNSMNMTDPSWFSNNSKCQSDASNILEQINKLKAEQFEIEHYDNTVYYDTVKPMTYLIFAIIGGVIAGLGALGAFIIYLVKGKKTY